MKCELIKESGALHEGANRKSNLPAPGDRLLLRQLDQGLPDELLTLIPASVAHDHHIVPLSDDGETIVCAAADPDDIALCDKLRFILARDVRFIPAHLERIQRALDRDYGQPSDCADSMLQEFTDTAIDFTEYDLDQDDADGQWRPPPSGLVDSMSSPAQRRLRLLSRPHSDSAAYDAFGAGALHSNPPGAAGMFFYTVWEGKQVLVCGKGGAMEVVAGPRRVWNWGRKFIDMQQHTAHPGQFLRVHFRDGRQEHLAGPAELWFDPRIHSEIQREDALQISAKEAIVVYSQPPGKSQVTRRIVHGPALFVPAPGEWLHQFSWHASSGGSRGVQKTPHGLVFNKLWLMPDQMYHDVPDVRTSDDAVLTIRLMIFFELLDIEQMLQTTHDPIGDFVNAATSDVVELVGRHDFDSFKQNTDKLNDLATYRQLVSRASTIGYRITNVVYRGYGAPDSLQQMHNQAIEARTRLQLERATEQQSQDLENYKLQCQLRRASERRAEQMSEVEHDLKLKGQRQEAELVRQQAQREFARQQREMDTQMRSEARRRQDEQRREHLAALRDMNVDLTAYLTQGRADQVIELRGGGEPHLHLQKAGANGNAREGQEGGSHA